METKNKRKVTIIVVTILVLVLTIGGAFALWSYSKTLGNQSIVAGEIYMKYTGTNNLNVTNAMPSLTYSKDDYFEFNIVGKNTHKEDIIYEIVLNHGDEPEDEERTERIKDELLKFRLVEIKDGQEEELIQEGSFEKIDNTKIWVDRVEANTTNIITYKYRLYMWISNDTKIGNTDGADYDADLWNKIYASIKVTVNGDFNKKELTEDYIILNAKNESGEPYDLKQPIQSDEDITITLGSKREITKFVVEQSEQNPIALMNLEEPTDYTASYNETTRAWEAKVTIDETGIYKYYAVYPEGKGQSKEYSFTVIINPDRFAKVEKPTSALCNQGLTYTGSPQDLIDESNLDQTGYTITQVQGTDANSYEVKAHLKEKFRWADSSQENATFNCIIEPKETTLIYEPASGFKVGKGLKNSFKIIASTEGTFEVTSKASGTANAAFEPSSGTTTTVTVNGIEVGNTSLNIKFTPTNNNYAIKTSSYSVQVKNVLTTGIATEVIKDTIDFEGGIIGVTTSNNKTINKDASNIREYRYSGGEVNNYIYFNCNDSTSEQNDDNCETWRIIGIFKDDSGREQLKIVRNSSISNMASGSSDWSHSSVYTYLNGSYLTSLSNKAQKMIEEAKWYLGTISSNPSPIASYSKERSGDTWTGKVAPMYPSDYGYSFDSNYWYTPIGFNLTTTILETNWLYKTSNHSGFEWFLSPSSDIAGNIATWFDDGHVRGIGPSITNVGVRPSLYLKSTIQIIGGNGSSEQPYQLQYDTE